ADGSWGFNMQHQKGRFPWWKVVCCPGSISRTIPQIPAYMYAHAGDDLYVTLYSANESEIALDGGKVKLSQKTEYPFDGRVALTVRPETDGQEFSLRLRIPTWAQDRFMPGELYSYTTPPKEKWQVRVNGKPVKSDELDKGFVVIKRAWKQGDKVELYLPMPVQFSTAYYRAVAFSGRVAATRGPLVYCAEEADNGMQVQRLAVSELPTQDQIKISTIQKGILKGVRMISFPGDERLDVPTNLSGREFAATLASPLMPYKGKERPATIRLVPYYSWNNRGEKSMTVWLPHKVEATEQGPLKWIAASETKPPISVVGNGTKIIFENKSGRRVKIVWIGYKGEQANYGELAPGGTREQTTYSNSTWMITDENDKPLGHFISGIYTAHAVIPKLN
ncbi:MAG: glycoside hydrolase family 127 protein, partial [Planctomycetales bacterium]